jgi:hypothetical protein
MTDEGPLDLKVLDPGDPPDVAGRAVRRFRLHVVLSTVVCVVAGSIVAGALIAWLLKDEPQTEAIGWSPAQTAILNDLVGICDTPTYTFGDLEVGLTGAVRMPDGGYALHFLLRGPVTIQRETDDGGGFRTFTSIIATEGEGARVGQVSAQAGATWGEVYVGVPSGVGPDLELLIQGPALDEPQSFTVRTDRLREGC